MTRRIGFGMFGQASINLAKSRSEIGTKRAPIRAPTKVKIAEIPLRITRLFGSSSNHPVDRRDIYEEIA